MNNNRIIQIINKPEKLEFSDKNYIEEELSKYPFAQSFQMLYLKWKHQFVPEELNESVQKVSIYTNHRELIQKELNEKKLNKMPVLADKGKDIDTEDKMTINKEEQNIQKQEDTQDIQEILEIKQKECKIDEYFGIDKARQQEELIINLANETVFQSTQEISEAKYIPQDNEQKTDMSHKNIDKLGLSHLFLSNFEEREEIVGNNDTQNEINDLDLERSKEVSLEIVEQQKESSEQTDEKNEEVKKANSRVEINKVLLNGEELQKEDIITPVERLTFNQWISLTKQKSLLRSDKKAPSQEKQSSIISNFIENNPKITPPKKELTLNKEVEFKKEEIQDIANLMTITLAQLYVEQGKYDTAITAFKILSLKYPEKSSYFASEVRKIKKIKNSK